MAGDWIKMRSNLWDDPRVGRLCDLTGSSEASVIGALYWLWSAADQHTEDGCMPGLSLQQIDRKTGVKGIGAALVSIDWLHDDPQGVVIARFSDHNGQTAKRRASEAQRKALGRSVSAPDADNPRTGSGQHADEARTQSGRGAELEKEREKNTENPPTPRKRGSRADRFEEFWLAWPKNERKQDKAKCLDHWKRNGLDETGDAILADVRTKRGTKKWQEGYIEAPLVYLRGRRWADGVVPDADLPASQSLDWRDTGKGIRAMGLELGLGDWDEAGGEHFPAYRARVERAWREREHGPVDKAGMQKIADLLGNVVKKVA